MSKLYIGLMSGTSTDGVDAVLAKINTDGSPNILGHVFLPMPSGLRQTFLALNQSGADELHDAAIAANELAKLYASAVQTLLKQQHIEYTAITAIGAHGQTVRHAPQLGYTIQINAPALLAELTKIDVIADFRSADIAAKGHGAPLVPIFHQKLFCSKSNKTVVINLGGIANITVLHTNNKITGFDTGPANILLDAWIQKNHNLSFDANGAWAKTGALNNDLLDYLISSEPWFKEPPPKSTGRDLFNLNWLTYRLNTFFNNVNTISDANADIQATLAHLSAKSIVMAMKQHAPLTNRVIICGGGAFNDYLIEIITGYCSHYFENNVTVTNCIKLGIAPDQVEALAFAWLAWAYDNRQPANIPEVTGATGLRILGCKHLAS